MMDPEIWNINNLLLVIGISAVAIVVLLMIIFARLEKGDKK